MLTHAQDIFQRMMDQILDCCEGVIRIADDIIVHGEDDVEHDRRLHKFMKVTREHQGDTFPIEQSRDSELRWNGNISLTIHPTTIFSHSNTSSEDF